MFPTSTLQRGTEGEYTLKLPQESNRELSYGDFLFNANDDSKVILQKRKTEQADGYILIHFCEINKNEE